MEEEMVDRALSACLVGKDGEIVLQWLVQQMLDHKLTMMITSNGADALAQQYRLGASEAYRDLLYRAGYRITYERKPDDNDSDGTNDPGTNPLFDA